MAERRALRQRMNGGQQRVGKGQRKARQHEGARSEGFARLAG